MAETASEQRARVLSASDSAPWEYDLAVALGYRPESWTGMYKLTVSPFTILAPYVIVTEVATDHKGRAKWNGTRRLTRARLMRVA